MRQPGTTRLSRTPIPSHPNLVSHRLDNGLVARVIPHPWPEGYVELRLVLRAGSVLEDADQQGIAHVLEHLAFRGTRRYPDDGVVRALGAYGSRFGAHLNATTSFETTIYKLQLPNDAVPVGLEVMREWADGLTIDGGAIETERLVVLEEWRRGRGAQARVRDVLHPLFFGDSSYAERLPIGTEESLRTFDPEVVRRFYADWYRPDLLGLLIVGDLDAATALTAIEAAFGDLSGPPSPRPRVDTETPVPDAPRCATVTDPETVHTEVALIVQIPSTEGDTEADYVRQHLLPGLIQRILQERLNELGRLSHPPFIQASASRSRVAPGLVHHALGARVQKGAAQAGIEALATEVKHLAGGGVSAGAIDRARARLIRDLQHLETEAERLSGRRVVQELIRHHTVGEPMPGAAIERQIAQRLLQDIDQNDVASACAAWFPEAGRVLTIVAPENETLPSADTALSTLSSPSAMATPAQEAALPAMLVAARPAAGEIIDVHTIPELDLTRWSLSNGARVWVKPTSFKTDEVQLHLQALGGTSLAEDDAYIAARTSVGITTRSGMGDMDATTVARFLAGRTLGLRPLINEHWHGLRGVASSGDLATLLDLVWMRITAPRFDPIAFENERNGRRDTLANRKSDPAALFRGRYKRKLWQNHPRIRPWKVRDLGSMDVERSRAFFGRAMGMFGAGDLIVVGAIDLAELEPLVCATLGALPTPPEAPQWVDRGRRAIDGPDRIDIVKGQTPRASVRIRFGGPYTDTPDSRYALRATAGVLGLMLRADLREQRGGTYNVGVHTTTVRVPYHFWAVTLSFDCDPERTEELIDAALETVKRLQQGDFPDHRISEIQAQHARGRTQQLSDNGFWLDALALTLRRDEDPLEILWHADRIAALDKDTVTQTANRRLVGPPQLIGVLQPAVAPQP
jgi:zinc protease